MMHPSSVNDPLIAYDYPVFSRFFKGYGQVKPLQLKKFGGFKGARYKGWRASSAD